MRKNDEKKKTIVVICRKHWPDEMPSKMYRGKERPIDPPSIFPLNITSSYTVPPSKTRETRRSLSSVRSVLPDELEQFLSQDLLAFEQVEEKLSTNEKIITFKCDDSLCIQSKEFYNGVPKFMFFNLFYIEI